MTSTLGSRSIDAMSGEKHTRRDSMSYIVGLAFVTIQVILRSIRGCRRGDALGLFLAKMHQILASLTMTLAAGNDTLRPSHIIFLPLSTNRNAPVIPIFMHPMVFGQPLSPLIRVGRLLFQIGVMLQLNSCVVFEACQINETRHASRVVG
jgi:hypothetical protein